ncbi:uncharacterized protein IL334_003842 [Kwoniella shivajii]|uniref:Ribosomal protein mS38 C-terminal domain-containing protein n=1 Tax=Kwoniella shivajii TaxID=564305 RepID=A0ABZ1CYR3_9TREE|nr:hypothetical protein IL334_003842 [Kwoniella shivajii]
MLLRRLYSSLPSTRVTGPHGHGNSLSGLPTNANVKSKPQTRGRIKPRSTTLSKCKTSAPSTASTSLSTSRQISSISRSTINAQEGRGRKRPSTSSVDLTSPRHFTNRNDIGSEINVVSDSNQFEENTSSNLNIFEQDDHMENEQIRSKSNSTLNKSNRLTFTHPQPSDDHHNSFKPIYLYPEQFKLHTTFTHPSHPLPLNLGTAIYTNPRKSSSSSSILSTSTSASSTTFDSEDLFSAPPPPDPTKALKRKVKGNGLNDHFRVISNLSHPSLIHHLGNDFNPWASSALASASGFGGLENEFGGLSSQLSHKLSELKSDSENQWQTVLSKLEGKPSNTENLTELQEQQKAMEKDDNLHDVVIGLNDVLARLGLSSSRGRKTGLMHAQVEDLISEEGVHMDSVKRKRKKKISKHKYKKRRKSTRALRKKLGK